jgi:hypothetical protein
VANFRSRCPLRFPDDYRALLPYPAGAEFSVKMLGEKAGQKEYVARRACYTLFKMGILARRRDGRKYVYWKESS